VELKVSLINAPSRSGYSNYRLPIEINYKVNKNIFEIETLQIKIDIALNPV